MSEIDIKYSSLGGAQGFLGSSVTGELVCPDGTGHYRHYQNGSIYWSPLTGAHEIHGLIRGYWESKGWETNSELGYPISDEIPTSEGSKNRYNDFENGVVFWKYGNDNAVPLSKLTINNASRTAGEVVLEINKIITPALTSNSSVYIKNGPYLAEVTDYSYDGSAVHNRRYRIHVNIGIDVSAMPDPTSNIDLWIEISYDRSDKKVKAYLTNWSAHTHVPWPTSMGVSASSINNKFRSALDPMLWKPNVVSSIPAGINILSVKVVPNGDLNVYIEPACFITTACTEAKGLPDDCVELETLRKFRNEYLVNLPEGNEILNEYSWIAPQIVHKINTLDNSKSIYEYLFERLVRKSVDLIQEGKMEEAYKNYMSIVNELKDKYVVE